MKDESPSIVGNEYGQHDRSEPEILMRALLDAITSGERSKVSWLLDEHPSQLHAVFSKDVPNQLLHNAASRGDAALVEMLVDRGVDVNAKGDNDATPLHAAARCGHVGVAA